VSKARIISFFRRAPIIVKKCVILQESGVINKLGMDTRRECLFKSGVDGKISQIRMTRRSKPNTNDRSFGAG